MPLAATNSILGVRKRSYRVTVHDKGFRLNQDVGSYADWITMNQGDMMIPKMDATEPLLREARHFIECLRKKATPLSDGASGALAVAVLEHGQRSLETGQTVAIAPLGLGPAPLRRAS